MEGVYRAACRTQVTKLCNTIAEYLKDFTLNAGDGDASEASTAENTVVTYLQRIKNAHANLKRADESVRDSIKPEDFQRECESVIEYDDKAVMVIAQLEHVLNTHFKASAGEAGGPQIGQVNPIEEVRECNGVRLKSFELKKFDGKFENWLPFWEQFKRAVHENRKFSAATKFNYLNGALIGQAAATIAGFTPTESCYSDAISLLLEEYGNTEKIVEKYLQKLITLKIVHNSSDVHALRQLYNEVSAIIRSLSALRVPSHQYDIVAKSVLLKALPVQLRVQYHRFGGKGSLCTTMTGNGNSTTIENSNGAEADNSLHKDDNLKTLLDFMKVELEAMEKAQLSERDKKCDERDQKKMSRTSQGTVTALHVSNKSNPQCIFCKSTAHSSKNCTSSMNIEERKQLLKQESRCFRCGNKNHSSKFCRAQWVKCDGCGGRHLTPMCERSRTNRINLRKSERNDIKQQNDKSSVVGVQVTSTNNVAEAATLNAISAEQNKFFLQTAKAVISNVTNNERVLSRVIMDNGSQRTYITEKLADLLKLSASGVEKMRIVAFGGKNSERQPTHFKSVQLGIKGQFGGKARTITAIVVPNICIDVLPAPKIESDKLKYLKLELADTKVSNENFIDGINLLIGQDHFWQFNTDESKRIAENLVAVKTLFGWTIQGCSNSAVDSCVLSIADTVEQTFDISDFWKLESVGITNCQPNAEQDIIEKAMLNINNINGRYVVNLPWRLGSGALADNKQVALARLRGLTARLIKDGNKLFEYDAGIRELLQNGIAEAVHNSTCSEKVYYMPHRPVYREDKATTKMRIVFDASSSEVGFSSLNDQLSAGSNMVANLLATLIKFRSNPIALTADIEKAFLQIALAEGDRDSHRFLWYSSTPNVKTMLPSIAEYRMARVTFGVASSPFLLAATLQTHLDSCKTEYGAICDKLKASFYVDDLVLSVRKRKDAADIFQQATSILSSANFNLRKWNTNDVILKASFPVDKQNECTQTKVLGVSWCTAADELSVDVSINVEYLQSLRGTKRNVMKAMAKVYDPLGLLAPFVVRLKILLQNVWKANLDWDKTLDADMLSSFQCWQEELPILNKLAVRRSLTTYSGATNEIHIFADASPKAYGAVAYLRQISGDREIATNFICSKNRVAPLEKNSKNSELSLPKLELTAALMAARLKAFLAESIDCDIEATYMWTDSTITLSWIRGCGKQLKPYVKARVSEINTLTNIYEWRHCEGKSNPADLITRGVKAKLLAESVLWKYGPSWLLEEQEYWPNDYRVEQPTCLATTIIKEDIDIYEPLLKIYDFSSMKRLLRVTAYVFRFLKSVKGRKPQKAVRKTKSVACIDELTHQELREAESYWVKDAQRSAYDKEIGALKRGSLISSDSKILTLNPKLENGVMVLNGRLQGDEFGCRLANPIILPKKSYFSQLLIIEAHRATLHGGVNAVLCHIRKKFWIVQGRQIIKNTIQRCVTCKRLYAKNASEPWTVLPAERLTTERVFQTTGVDFAGPLYVKADGDDSRKKVYIMLFTCAAIRAVHLELVVDMTVKSCIEALRRFIARRGTPNIIISDNAKTFKRADLELRKLEELVKNKEVLQMAAYKGITWKYIPERGSWWGGFWERLVRSVKNALKASIGKAVLNSEELRTLLTEVESVVNARPLTYITNSEKDLQPLTPSNFLIDCNSTILPTDFQADGSAIALAWEKRQVLLRRYMKRWRQEYLQQLRSIHHNKRVASHSISVGDVVLVHDDNKPRLQWKLGVVQSTYPGRDGRVRVCDVRMQGQQVLKRPVQLLYPLEISSIAGPEDVEN